MNLRVSQKLGAIIGLLAFSAAGLSAFAFWQSRLQERESAEIQSIYDFALQARSLAESVEHVVVIANDALASDDKETMKAKLGGLHAALEQLNNVKKNFLTRAGDNLPEAQKTRLALEVKEFVDYQNDTVELGLTISPKAALVQANDEATVKNRETMISQMEAFAQSALDRLSQVRSANLARRQKVEAFMIGVPASVIVIGVLIALWVFTTQIRRPLESIIAAMQRVAAGDLEARIPFVAKRDEIGDLAKALVVFRDAAVAKSGLERETQDRRDEDERRRAEERTAKEAIERERATVIDSVGVGLAKLAARDLKYRMSAELPESYRKLQTDFNAAIAVLEEVMRSVSESTNAIQSGTEDIATSADDLSRRTETQTATLEEATSALQEITSTVRKSAESTVQAARIVADADTDARTSAEVVRNAVEAMDGIAKSAHQINQIIGVIDEIAFQTNLLALNAGVEAARAGEAGRGFAVVASEVRGLAQRSTESAKQIKALITTSTRQVENGVKLVGETGESLGRIMSEVSKITAIVGEISAGAEDQSAKLAEVNTAIHRMNLVTQENSAMVEESTAATHSLSREITRLSSLIGEFQVGFDPQARHEGRASAGGRTRRQSAA